MGKYYCTYSPEHHRSTKEGYVYTLILVAEEKLGRKLRTQEVVHHIDANKLNNAPENLLVFATKADHVAYHAGGDLIPVEDYYVSTRKSIKYNNQLQTLCPLCGELMTYGAQCCAACYYKKQRKVSWPSREELWELVKTTPFTKIGKMYEVTDNAVRKWCKNYELPFRRKDIETLKTNMECI